MLNGCSWFRITAGQKDYAGRMKLMEESRNDLYATLGVPPGPPTNKGIWGEPETTGQALTNTTLGNYDIPDNWPQPPVKNKPGDVPGPPVQYGPAVNPDEVAPGYGFSQSLPQREDDIYFYHSDHLGSTSYVTDADANPTQFVCYMPFGEAFVDEHTTRPEMPYKFNGKEQDAETGLYYYGARYYEPGECRFYGVDPLAEQHPNYNPVAYCYNNPVNFIDPLGLDTLAHGATGVKAGDVYNNGDGTYTPAQSTQLNEVTVTADKKAGNTNDNVGSSNGTDLAQSQGGHCGDELLIELNIKFGGGYEKSFNLGGFGVKGKASATIDYMTFRLTEKGFQYIPYRKATIEGAFGHAMLNGGVKMEHDGYNSQWSANGTIANFDLSTGQAPMITPISFGYQMPIGFGVDFKFGVDMYSAFESFDRLDRVHRQVTGVGIWHGPKY